MHFVAPRAGAWIETKEAGTSYFEHESHPVRVRGLKLTLFSLLVKLLGSHPVRVRGLKLSLYHCRDLELMSHPVRVRGLKLKFELILILLLGRTPCGCVD